MGYDPYSPIAPALINILCIPADRSKPEEFNRCLGWLQKSARILTPLLNGASYLNGSGTQQPEKRILLCDFDSYLGIQEQQGGFFEPNRSPCLILGLLDGASGSINASNHESFDQAISLASSTLRAALGSTSLATIPAHLVVFDAPIDIDVGGTSFVSTNSQKVPEGFSTWLYQAVINRITDLLTDLRSQEVELPRSQQPSKRLSSTEYRSEDVKRQSILPSLTRTPTETNTVSEDGAQIANSGKTIAAALLKIQLGAWNEALDQLAEGARAARDANSLAWHAKALEGILVCLLLLAWSGSSFQIPQNCYPTSRGLSSSSAVHNIAEANRSISEKYTGGSTNHMQALTAMIPGLMATIMTLYDRSVMGFDNGLPFVYACEAKVRMGKLLIVVQQYGSVLNDEVLYSLIGNQDAAAIQSRLEPATVALVLRSSTLCSLLLEAVNEAQNHLSVQALLPIYLTICNDLHLLKLDRKQGFYLKDILQRLPPILIEARRIGAAETNSSPSHAIRSIPVATGRQHSESSKSIRALLLQLVQAYNLPDLQPENDGAPEVNVQKRLSLWLTLFKSGDIATKLEVLRCCIRVSDAISDLTGSVRFMSLLLFVVRQTITVRRGVGSPVPLIAAEEQARLATGINNAVQVAKSLHRTDVLAQYWDDFVIRDISLYMPPGAGKLMAHSSQDLSHATKSGTVKKDPFIYNPFAEDQASSGPSIIMRNELVMFEVLLQNPLEIDIEIEKISLNSDGCSFEAIKHSVLIAPLCLQTVTLTGVPREVGSLKIVGCHVKAKNCASRAFTTFKGTWKPVPTTKKAQPSLAEVELPGQSVLELSVVDTLPNLLISSTSLVQDSIMLLDGEKTTFTIKLENVSDIHADLVLFSFQDSVSRQLQDAISTKELAPNDIYELQHQLATRPAIRRIGQDHKSRVIQSASGLNVPRRSFQSFIFEVLGKPGLTEAVVLIDYTYLGQPQEQVDGTFYTRQLRLAVNITVNASVDIPRCNVLAMPCGTADLDTIVQGKHAPAIKSAHIIKSSGSSICLLQLDLRSIWQSPITFTIEQLSSSNDYTQGTISDSENAWSVVATSTLQPTQVERALLLIPRLYIANPFEQIPSLDTNAAKRQFVVSASKLSLEAETSAREAFWYREELCRTLRFNWKEEYGTRCGDIDIRKGIRLSARMVDALKIEHVQVEFSLISSQSQDGETTSRISANHFRLRCSHFARLVVKVHNLTQEDLRLLLRIQTSLHDQPHDVAMDLNKKLAWSGVLQQVLAKSVKPGEAVEAELGVVALARSVFEINATVEEVRSQRRGLEGVSGVGQDAERRIWHARSPCLITVID